MTVLYRHYCRHLEHAYPEQQHYTSDLTLCRKLYPGAIRNGPFLSDG
jgi:hypothetical protein